MFIFASLLLYPGIHAILLFPKISHLSGMTGMDWGKRDEEESGEKKNPKAFLFPPPLS